MVCVPHTHTHTSPSDFAKRRSLLHKKMMHVACTLRFCGCTSSSCDQEDDQHADTEQECVQFEHEHLQRLSTPNLYTRMFIRSAYKEMHKNLYTPLTPTIFVNLKDKDHYFLERARYMVDLLLPSCHVALQPLMFW